MATAKITVTATPLATQTRPKNSSITNPSTGTAIFGMFPQIKGRDVSFVGGPILLRFGSHQQRWGFEHIWHGHFSDIPDFVSAEPEVTSFVCRILSRGAAIHYEYLLGKAEKKSTVFRNQQGVVIVEERPDGKNGAFYSIVTAFPAARVHGSVIGRLK